MLQLLCKENNLEYTGSGFLQCRKHVECPKKENNRILGFDCIIYIDNIPDGCDINISEKKYINDNIVEINVTPPDLIKSSKGHMQIVPASDQVE